MPWKNRYIGNPVLTGILNLFFNSGINDAHCGLRAISKDAFSRLGLAGTGMEFASEMVIKATLKGMRVTQVPATLSVDLRDRAPHLRPWRDGWRHLRYLLMLSPTWVFGVPAMLAMGASSLVFLVGLLYLLDIVAGPTPFGASWSVAAGFLFTVGHFAAIMAFATHFHGVRNGYRLIQPVLARHANWLTLETMIVLGLLMISVSLAGFVGIGIYWSNSGFVALPNILPLVITAVVGATGAQTLFGGFLLAVLGGNEADFLRDHGDAPA
jgi:hypothetical protein